MKKLIYFLMAMLPVIFAACEADTPDEPGHPAKGEWKTCPMRLNASFGGELTRAAHELQDGDMIYVSFEQPDDRAVEGYATYSAETGGWTFKYKGEMQECENLACSVVYMGNSPFLNEEGGYVELSYASPVFYSDDASFSFGGGGVDLGVILTPSLARFKFKGNYSRELLVKGIDVPWGFWPDIWRLLWTRYYETIRVPMSSSVTGTGYESQYIYADFTEDWCEHMRVKNDYGVFLLKKGFTGNMKVGGSYLLDVPASATSYNTTQWVRDSERSKTLPNSTSGFTSGNFTSNVGCVFAFDYKVLSVSSNPILKLEVTATGSESWTRTITYDSESFEIDVAEHDEQFIYFDTCNTYNVKVIVENMEIEMTNISLSNF